MIGNVYNFERELHQAYPKMTFRYILLLVHLYSECASLTVTLSFLLLFYPRAILPLLSDITLKDGNKQPPALAPSESPTEMPVPVHAKGSSPAAWTGVGKRT